MAILSTVGSKANCALSALIGSGNLGCPFEFQNLAGGEIRFWKKGTVVPKTTDYKRSFIRAQQVAGNVVVMTDIYDFSWNNEENVIKTADSSGLKSRLDDGKYEFTLMFKKGLYNQKQLSSISIDNYWEIQLIDSQGNELWANNSNGDFVGLATALCSVNPVNFKTRGEDQLTSITIQLSKPKQVNDDLAWIDGDSLDYGVGEIDGANQVALTIPSAPADGATTFLVQAVLDKDKDTYVDGLLVTNFNVKVNGATVTPSGVVGDATTKKYTFTVSALSTDDTIDVTTFTAISNSTTVSVGTAPNDKLYKSATVRTVVVA